MKGVFILMGVIAIALFAAYQFGGIATLDPVAQAAEFRDRVKPGLTWDQVADYRAPKKIYPIASDNLGGERQPVDFDRAAMVQAVQSGRYAEGFKFKYQFSADDAYEVWFASDGRCQAVEQMTTANDLLHGRTWQR